MALGTERLTVFKAVAVVSLFVHRAKGVLS